MADRQSLKQAGAAAIAELERRQFPADSHEARRLAHARSEWTFGNYRQAAAELHALMTDCAEETMR